MNAQGSEEEAGLKFIKGIVKLAVWVGRMNGENRNEEP